MMLCVSPTQHIHADLQIWILGQPLPIPANIGVSRGGVTNPHTVDTTGRLHMGEGGAPGLGTEERVAVLRDFFDIWRERGGRAGNNPQAFFSREQLMQYRADDVRRVRLMVNGDQNFEYENYAPCDDDQIVIEYYIDGNLNAWHNAARPTDVNRQDGTSPLDALLVINELSLRAVSDPETGALPAITGSRTAIDVDNNLLVTPLDALLVINALPSTSPRAAFRVTEALPGPAGQDSSATETYGGMESAQTRARDLILAQHGRRAPAIADGLGKEPRASEILDRLLLWEGLAQ